MVFHVSVAQVDSLEFERPLQFETANPRIIDIDTYADQFDPQKALIFSALLPGGGQAYNHSYWKIPIIYGGFAVGGYLVNYYHQQYSNFRGELFDLLNDSGTSQFTEEQLRRAVSIAQRQRDYWIIINGFWYLLQIVEAHVDAHLKEFKLNPELQVKVSPFLDTNQLAGRSGGLSLRFTF